MNPSRRGLSTAAKAAAVVVVIVIVLGAAYVLPTLSKGASSHTPTGPIVNVGAGEPSGMYSLVQDFPKMTIQVDTNDVPDQITSNQTVAYTVLGTGTINSTKYTKVEFITVGEEHDVVAWFNSTGGLGEVDVLGQRNYTGNALDVLPYIATYTEDFAVFPQFTNNATLFSELVPSGSTNTSIGPTNANLTTYVLGAPTPLYTDIVVKYATPSGTNLRLAVYIYEKAVDKSTESVQIISLTT